jgi:SAM-dependent methyltransferase
MDKHTQQNLLKTVENNYREISDDFNTTRNKYLWPEIFNLAEMVKDGDTVLDVGCGNGRLLNALKDKQITYLGVDNSQELVRLAEEQFKTIEKKANHYFRVGNILDLGRLPQFNFDYVFCVAVLHHLPGENLQIDALRQLKNKVKDDGKIILTVWNLWRQKKYASLILKFWLLKFIGKNKMDLGDILFDWKNTGGERVSQRYYHAFRWSELNKIVKKSGLKIEKRFRDKHNFYLILTK